jgi:ATP-dependent DNA ligase
MRLSNIEKDKRPSEEILRLFEKTRVAYLSAANDPQEYGSRWRNVVETIVESYNELDAAGNEMKDFVSEDLIENNDIKDPSSLKAKELFEAIKLLRYSSDLVNDPFAKRFKGKVLETLLENPEEMVKFVHYALRDDKEALPEEVYAIKDIPPDDITYGLEGLDLEPDDIALYIIEHYGDGKDSKRTEKAVEAAMEMLELLMLSRYDEKELDELTDIEGVAPEKQKKSFTIKKEKKSEEEKALTDFIIPNKPMYRIFDIDDIEELKGFSGEWFVQEKYDGMRIQLQKIDNNIKIFSFNKKLITDKCKEIADELKAKHFGDCILDAELILFDEDEPLHRADTIAHVFKNKYPKATLKCHVFDIMRHENQTLLDEELEDRMTIMFNNYAQHSADVLKFPSKKDTRRADNLKDIAEYAKEIMEMPTSEGVVIKDATSTYYIGTKKNPKWIKWKKFVDLDVIVLDKKKTKSNLYSYTVGVGPVVEENKFTQEIDGIKYMNVGKALNTKISAEVGEIIRVKVDEVKNAGERYTLYSAKVIEIPEVEYPDKIVTLELLAQDTKKSLNYSIEGLKKGITITDHIHGTATIICKSDMVGFTVYGFEENNLMSKNAAIHLDDWKSQAEQIMKTKAGTLTVAITNYLQENGEKTVREVHNFLASKHKDLYEDVIDGGLQDLGKWANQREHISLRNGKLYGDGLLKMLLKSPILVSREEEPEEEIGDITIDSSDKDGECCEKLKEVVKENRIAALDAFVKLFDGWDKVYAHVQKHPEHAGELWADNYEEEKQNIMEAVDSLDCDILLPVIDDFLNNKIDGIDYGPLEQALEEYQNCIQGDSSFTDKYAMLKADYKTPEKYREGQFKLYSRQDDNLNMIMKLGDETINWLIDTQNEEEMFDLFGAAGKYPAEVAQNTDNEKVVDSGVVKLGIQRNGYHEYFLEGNKFETKFHVRYLPVGEQKMWLAWTGYEQKPADKEGDEGLWNIYEDRFSEKKIPR